MHYNERIKCDSLEINGDSIKKIKEMLLEKVFLTRFKNGMNDSDFFQNLYDYEYISHDDIYRSFFESKLLQEDVTYDCICVICAVAHNAVNNEQIQKLVSCYLADMYLKGAENEHYHLSGSLPIKLVKKLHDGKLSKDLAAWASFEIINHVDSRIEIIRAVYGDCIKHDILSFLDGTPQCDLLDTVSDLLLYDCKENTVLIERFQRKRTRELFEYLCRKADISSDGFTDNEIYYAICATACGCVHKNHIKEYKFDKLVKSGFFKKTSDDFSSKMVIHYCPPITKLGVTVPTTLASSMLYGEFSRIHKFKGFESACLDYDNNRMFVHNSVLEYLIDVLTDARFSDNKKAFHSDQIVRKLQYNETDCKIVLEKISAAIQSYVLIQHIGMHSMDIVNCADYSNMKWLFQTNTSRQQANKKKYDASALINKTKADEIKELNKRLEAEKNHSSQIEKENNHLKEQLIALTNQLDKKESANELVKSLKEQIEILNDENQELSLSLNKLRERETHASEDINPDAVEEKIDESFFADKKAIIVGGRWEINRKLAEWMPKAKFVENATDELLNVRLYDVVIFFTEFISHITYNKYINQCRIYGAPVLYLKGSNLDKLKKDLYLFLNTKEVKK